MRSSWANRKRLTLSLAASMLLLAAAGCNRDDASAGTPEPSPGAGQTTAETKHKGRHKGPTYTLKVTPPEPVESGEPAKAVVQVRPRGRYKINLEFPLRLSVSGPAVAAPKSLELRKAQAAKLSEQELRVEPTFTLGQAGEHPFKGTLRFSVCTKSHCEIKSEEISWTTTVR